MLAVLHTQVEVAQVDVEWVAAAVAVVSVVGMTVMKVVEEEIVAVMVVAAVVLVVIVDLAIMRAGPLADMDHQHVQSTVLLLKTSHQGSAGKILKIT